MMRSDGIKNQRNTQAMTKALIFLLFFFLGYGFCFFCVPRSATIISNNTPCPPLVEKQQQQQQQPEQQPVVPPPHDFFQFPSECSPALPQSQILPILFSKIYNNSSPYVDFPPHHLRLVLRSNAVHGWGSKNSVFETLIQSTKPRVIIEIGSFLGASALHMASITRTLGLTNTIILCMDDFRGWPAFRDSDVLFNDLIDINGDVILMQQFMKNVMDAGEHERVIPVPFGTGPGLSALCQWGIYGDLIEVDAGHNFHSAWEDINRAWAVLRPGGAMFGHDYYITSDNYGVRRAVDLFAKTKGLRVELDEQHWVLVPAKPLDSTSLQQ